MITISMAAGGRNVDVEYVLVKTTAPVEYDSFGSFTVYASGDDRIVMIRTEHADYHKGRYASGLYTYEAQEVDQSIGHWIIEKLMDKLIDGAIYDGA